MTCGLVHASYSLPEWQAVKLTFFAPWKSGPTIHTGKNNGFPFLDIFGCLKNTHKNPKFGKVRQVPTREFPTKFPDWTCLTLPNLGFLWVFFKYPKISKNGNPLFFPVPPAPSSIVPHKIENTNKATNYINPVICSDQRSQNSWSWDDI